MSRGIDPNELPAMLTPGETVEFLGTSRTQLKNLYPYIHHMVMPFDTRRFPRIGIVAFDDYLQMQKAPLELAWTLDYLQDPVSEQAMDSSEAYFFRQVGAAALPEYKIRALDIAEILHASRRTVESWSGRDALPIEQEWVDYRKTSVTSIAKFLEACKWHRPTLPERKTRVRRYKH